MNIFTRPIFFPNNFFQGGIHLNLIKNTNKDTNQLPRLILPDPTNN